MIEYPAAVDEMYAMFLAKWNAETAAIVGYVPEIRFKDKELGLKPIVDKYWCRVSHDVLIEQQDTLGDCGEAYKKRYTNTGMIFVQLFAPKTDKDGGEKLILLGVVARNAYRGKTSSGGIWFRKVTIKPLPKEDAFYKSNVVAEYEFSEKG